MKKTFYITTPIYYPSGNPHIGHCYTTVACDTIARYKRWQGYDVMFSTGTDEHGMKIEESAKKAGKSPQEYVDEIAGRFKRLWKFMNVSYDRFIRTTDDYHKEAVQKIFKAIYDKGYIYKGEYKGKYCVPDESFWTESQLVGGKCPECGRDVIDAKEEAYFMKMRPFAEQIEKLLTETDYLQPRARVNEMVNNFIKPGLEDLCVSRTTFKWGIPVPFDPEHVVYVWIDALSNYITLLGYENGAHDDFGYWAEGAEIMHMTAKDIVRFHSIIWIAILSALDLPFPKRLYSHGWFNFEGKKMSKSLGNVVEPFVLGERYGVDCVRYQILRDMPFNGDFDYSNELMLTRINADLANNFGNLVSRTVAMIEKYFGGVLPENQLADCDADGELIALAGALSAKTDELIEIPHLSQALTEIFAVISRANKYIDETAPWLLAKDGANSPRLAAVLYNLTETVRICSSLLAPFMPETAVKVWEQIGAAPESVSYDKAGAWGTLPKNVAVKKGDIIFPRFDIEKELSELGRL
jgi:methionyl-tRNA synthetase